MNILGHTVKGVLLLANIGAGAGFLLCAYSPSLSPVAHPVLSCAGLFFPFYCWLYWCLYQSGCFITDGFCGYRWPFCCWVEGLL